MSIRQYLFQKLKKVSRSIFVCFVSILGAALAVVAVHHVMQTAEIIDINVKMSWHKLIFFSFLPFSCYLQIILKYLLEKIGFSSFITCIFEFLLVGFLGTRIFKTT